MALTTSVLVPDVLVPVNMAAPLAVDQCPAVVVLPVPPTQYLVVAMRFLRYKTSGSCPAKCYYEVAVAEYVTDTVSPAETALELEKFPTEYSVPAVLD